MSPGRSCLLEGPDRNPSPSPDPNPRPKPNQAAWKGPMRDMTSSRTLEVAPETAVCSNMPKRSADETCSAPPSKTSPAAASPIAVSRVLLPQPLPPSSAHRSLGMIVQSTPMIRGLEPAHTSKPRMRTAAPPVSACISGGDGGCTQPAKSGCINGRPAGSGCSSSDSVAAPVPKSIGMRSGQTTNLLPTARARYASEMEFVRS